MFFGAQLAASVHVIAWYRQATGHYLNQCWSRSLTPYGVIRPQWIIISVRWHCFSPRSLYHQGPLLPTKLALTSMEFTWFRAWILHPHKTKGYILLIHSLTSTPLKWDHVCRCNYIPYNTTVCNYSSIPYSRVNYVNKLPPWIERPCTGCIGSLSRLF